MARTKSKTPPPTGTAYYVERMLRRIALLEADVARARELVAGLPDDGVRDIKWLDPIARTEGQIQKLYLELMELTEDGGEKDGGPARFTIVSDIPRPGGEKEEDHGSHPD